MDRDCIRNAAVSYAKMQGKAGSNLKTQDMHVIRYGLNERILEGKRDYVGQGADDIPPLRQ
ncbi:unnamed protein product [Camellia sinensis]